MVRGGLRLRVQGLIWNLFLSYLRGFVVSYFHGLKEDWLDCRLVLRSGMGLDGISFRIFGFGCVSSLSFWDLHCPNSMDLNNMDRMDTWYHDRKVGNWA